MFLVKQFSNLISVYFFPQFIKQAVSLQFITLIGTHRTTIKKAISFIAVSDSHQQNDKY